MSFHDQFGLLELNKLFLTFFCKNFLINRKIIFLVFIEPTYIYSFFHAKVPLLMVQIESSVVLEALDELCGFEVSPVIRLSPSPMLPLGAAKFNCTFSIVLFFVSGTKHVTYKIALKFLQTGPQATKPTGNYNEVKTCKNFHKNRKVPKIKKTAPPMASLICG